MESNGQWGSLRRPLTVEVLVAECVFDGGLSVSDEGT